MTPDSPPLCPPRALVGLYRDVLTNSSPYCLSSVCPHQGYTEILLSCYSGRVVAYTTEPLHDRAADDSHGRSLGTIQNENKIKTLRKEIEALQAKVRVHGGAQEGWGGKAADDF